MKLTTQRLKELIREEIQKIDEEFSFKKTGVEKVKDPDTGEIIAIDHDKEMIQVVDKSGNPTGMRYVYEPDFATASPKNYIRMDPDKFSRR